MCTGPFTQLGLFSIFWALVKVLFSLMSYIKQEICIGSTSTEENDS